MFSHIDRFFLMRNQAFMNKNERIYKDEGKKIPRKGVQSQEMTPKSNPKE